MLLAPPPAAGAGRYDPRLHFRTLRTAHFTIYYHQGGSAMARRLAVVAEQVRTDLAARTGLKAPAHTHVVLVDQSDIANGWSTPVPYNLIELAAIAPPPSSFLGHHDDWLRIVFTHEFAHILHLDQVGGVMKGLRWTLGRNPASFPNLFVPQWEVEGFATWAESAVTGFGRVHAADVSTVVAAIASEGRATIDRAGGGLVAWPSGNTSYFQGGLFDQRLASRESSQALGDIARDTARRIPFLGGPAYRKVVHRPAGDVWNEVFQAPPQAPRQAAPDIRRLTREGFVVTGPRIVRRPGSPAVGPQVYFSGQGPHRFPDIRAVALAGGTVSHVTSRADGQSLSSDGRWLYFNQLEFDGSVAIVSDLYARDLDSGRVVRLSRGARLADPDVDARGTRLAAVRARDGGTRLVVLELSRGAGGAPALIPAAERLLGSPECLYATPRWSPGGRELAVVRQCPGSLPVVVRITLADGDESVVASGGRNVTPAWGPDGRTIVFASDRDGDRFRLYAADAAPKVPAGEPRLLLEVPGGAMWPDLDEAGGTIVFTSVTAEGWDLFAAQLAEDALPSPAGSGAPAQPIAPAPQHGSPPAGDDPPAPVETSYSPWATLLPRSWSPQLRIDGDDVGIGATAGATDALGYHQYSATAIWRASSRGAEYEFGGAPVSWDLAYAYNRWRPSFLASAWSAIDTVTVAVSGSAERRLAEERSRGGFAGLVVPWRRVRLTQSWLAGATIDQRALPDSARVAGWARNGLRAGWALNSSRQYGYSVSSEDGAWAAVNAERVTTALGADGDAWSLTWDLRGYLPGLAAHHVAAVRVAGASSTGDAAMRRTFDLGGTGLSPAPFAMNQRVIGLLRGLPREEREGPAALVANADYRFPLARVERGIRTWPIFLRDVHAALFADVGSAGDALDALPSAAWSVGGEVAARLTLGYTWNVSLAAGAAWVRDPLRQGDRDRVAVFVRTGYAF
jgi:Tol biopolymer transport system component